MPVKVSTEDMALVDYEEYCFFKDEAEEFYEDSLNKDLFKKFELHTPPQTPPHNSFEQLTPPHSPPHNPFPPDKTVDKRLQRASMLLDSWDECRLNLSSNLIQDCMWSGPCLAAAGLVSPASKGDKLKAAVVPLSPTSSNSDISSVSSTNNVDINSSECVSPAAVFPYPVNEPQKKVVELHNLGSVAETPSPSESEDEEIDVVTVVAEKMARKRHNPTGVRSSSPSGTAAVASFKSHVAAIHNYSNTHSPPVSFSAPQSPQASGQHRGDSCHSGHKRSRPMSMPASPQPVKKSRSLLHSTDLKRVAQKLQMGHQSRSEQSSSYRYQTSSSRNSSDSEEGDTNKRAQHNVLERKRRNDLKYSFLKLRDNVPELAKQERTPKVTILKQSADYLRKLTQRNKSLEGELQRTKLRYEHMKRKLTALRRECL